MNEKTIKKLKKIIPVSFIVLFAAFLVIPNTGFFRVKENVELIKRFENRNITTFPKEPFQDKKFYSNFENWYQDRLRYRNKAITIWKKTNFKFGVILKDNIVLGKDDWLFNKYRCISSFLEADDKVQHIKKLQNYCNEKKIGFIFSFPPNKESVYRDYLPVSIQLNYQSPKFWHDKAYNLLKLNSINFLRFDKEFFNFRLIDKHDLYFKDDHHWSYYGSAIAADLLLKKLQNDLNLNFYNGLKLDGSKKTAYKDCSYYGQLGFNYNYVAEAPWSKYYTEEIYLKDSYSDKLIKQNQILSENTLWPLIITGDAVVINKNVDNNLKILILGDSYANYMVPYLSQHLHTIILTHYRDCKKNKKEVNITKLIKKYKPNAIILMINEAQFYHPSSKNIFQNIKY